MTGHLARTHPPTPARSGFATRRLVPLAVIAAAVIAVIVAAATAGREITGTPHASTTPLQAARDHCMAGNVVDDGHTLVIDMRGEEAGSGYLTVSDIDCLLGRLNTPGSVTSQMDSTRALDGMRDASWEGLTATWTYHPDDGLDIVITDN